MTVTDVRQQTSNPDRAVPTRRMDFDEVLAQIPKHFAGDGDLLFSHFWATFSATLPEGEEFFVRSVRHYRDQITDPVLKKQVAGFIGQEAMHGRGHRAFNARLAELGYPMERIERFQERINSFQEKHSSPEVNLASTVVAEHFTALIAEMAMTDERVRSTFGHGAVRDIYMWHALEESEHKAVAFDVYRAVGGSERTRIWMMRIMRWTLFLMPLFTLISALGDRAAWRPGTLRKSWKRFRRSPFFSKEFRAAVKDFERPDFHPDQRSTDHLLEDWRDRLFGDAGTLNDKLIGSRAA
jgi:predicted metal-dependent hydrolase